MHRGASFSNQRRVSLSRLLAVQQMHYILEDTCIIFHFATGFYKWWHVPEKYSEWLPENRPPGACTAPGVYTYSLNESNSEISRDIIEIYSNGDQGVIPKWSRIIYRCKYILFQTFCPTTFPISVSRFVATRSVHRMDIDYKLHSACWAASLAFHVFCLLARFRRCFTASGVAVPINYGRLNLNN